MAKPGSVFIPGNRKYKGGKNAIYDDRQSQTGIGNRRRAG